MSLRAKSNPNHVLLKISASSISPVDCCLGCSLIDQQMDTSPYSVMVGNAVVFSDDGAIQMTTILSNTSDLPIIEIRANWQPSIASPTAGELSYIRIVADGYRVL
eukprot:scaffold37026_cov36-Cyclotella_meneghiniana.AAC.2